MDPHKGSQGPLSDADGCKHALLPEVSLLIIVFLADYVSKVVWQHCPSSILRTEVVPEFPFQIPPPLGLRSCPGIFKFVPNVNSEAEAPKSGW